MGPVFRLITVTAGAVFITACTSNDYQLYVDSTSKIIMATAASEAACLLVINEAGKTADNYTKFALASQLDKCRRDPPKIEPPKKNWFGF